MSLSAQTSHSGILGLPPNTTAPTNLSTGENGNYTSTVSGKALPAGNFARILESANVQVEEEGGKHHIGDFLPDADALEFMAKLRAAANGEDIASVEGAGVKKEEEGKIDSSNIGHKMLAKMGWSEGSGLGSRQQGRTEIINAGEVKTNKVGVGAGVESEEGEKDIFALYKSRMAQAYRHRPNPLGNPRKSYY
tara:strand:+ start:120 stop:698 length:579 start_codon:yes stop_codon:yes gene_type:complete